MPRAERRPPFMPSWSWAIVVSSSANACCGREGNPGSTAPATVREASSANSRRDRGGMDLERPAGQNHERASLVALRARDRAELQVREPVDVTTLEREGACGAEPDATAEHPRVTRGGPIGVGTGAATRAAPQLKGDLRAGVRVGRDAGRWKEGAQENRHVGVVELALVGRAGVGDAALRV